MTGVSARRMPSASATAFIAPALVDLCHRPAVIGGTGPYLDPGEDRVGLLGQMTLVVVNLFEIGLPATFSMRSCEGNDLVDEICPSASYWHDPQPPKDSTGLSTDLDQTATRQAR
jgi:hypothetical protein